MNVTLCACDIPRRVCIVEWCANNDVYVLPPHIFTHTHTQSLTVTSPSSMLRQSVMDSYQTPRQQQLSQTLLGQRMPRYFATVLQQHARSIIRHTHHTIAHCTHMTSPHTHTHSLSHAYDTCSRERNQWHVSRHSRRQESTAERPRSRRRASVTSQS